MDDFKPLVIFMERALHKYGLWQLVGAAAILIFIWNLPSLLGLFIK